MADNDFDDATERRTCSNRTEIKGKIRQEYEHWINDLEYVAGTQENVSVKAELKLAKLPRI